MRNFLALILAGLLLSAPHSALAIGKTSGQLATSNSAQSIPETGSIVLAAVSSKFKICKIRCKKKHRCGTDMGAGGFQDPGKAHCIKKRKACIRACPK